MSLIHNFLISYPILLKLCLMGLSDFSGSIESKLFLEWTWALNQHVCTSNMVPGRNTPQGVECVHSHVRVSYMGYNNYNVKQLKM